MDWIFTRLTLIMEIQSLNLNTLLSMIIVNMAMPSHALSEV